MESTEDRPPFNAWAFNQSLGDDSSAEYKETDTISALAFSPNGNYLAVGDKSGRIWIHQERKDKKLGSRRCYEHYTYFQSHSHDIDYLKSQDIEEKINMIKWCPPIHTSQLLLSTNDKTIKLWKVYNHFVHTLSGLNREFSEDRSNRNVIRVPRLAKTDTVPACSLKCLFRDGHSYHINSISLCSDCETFISTDDLRINLWNLSIPHVSFNILDMKPAHMEDLTEVITAAQFHPIQCNQMMFSSSRGILRLMDLRHRAILTTPDCVLEQEPDPNDRSFFSEIISSISDCQYSSDGRFIVSRDYLTAKIWDPRQTRSAYDTVPIHEQVRTKLAEVYENDSIFDKFEIYASSRAVSSTQLVTGSYDNEAVIYDWDKRTLDRLRPIRSSYDDGRDELSSYSFHSDDRDRRKKKFWQEMDYSNKCLHVSWHPSDDVVAVSCNTDLNIYQRIDKSI